MLEGDQARASRVILGNDSPHRFFHCRLKSKSGLL
jgi:hypothetical protein